ncbi:unnamed protein product [Symbiodinium microadriaticum]|nr:unnamed protein product [Symbiodinium microadriaticum]
MLRDDIIKVLEIVAVFLGDNRADDVEVFSGELSVAHKLSLCSAGVHVAMHSVCQAMQQRLIELHESFMLSHRQRFIALYRRHNRWTWTMTEEQAVAEADDDFEALLQLVELEHQDGPPTRRAIRARVRLECVAMEGFLLRRQLFAFKAPGAQCIPVPLGKPVCCPWHVAACSFCASITTSSAVMTTFSEPALEKARAELRDMAMDLVLSRRCLFTRLACRAVEHGGSMQAALKHGFRKLLVLVHPDKNNGSAKSELAAKELQKLREQPASTWAWNAFLSRRCERLGGFLYATYFRAYFGDTLYGKRLGGFFYGNRLRNFIYGDRLGDFYAELRAFFYLDPGYCGAFHRARRWAPCSRRQQKILVEPINGQYIRQFMNLRGTRALHTSCGRSMFEVLSFILEQSDEDLIKVKVRERRDSGGLKGRNFSGGGAAAAHIPPTFAQISPFAFERLIKQVFLAAWYTYRLIDELYSSEGFLYEDIWLNHMIFVTMISMALCLPVGIIWTMTVAHTLLFLAIESANGWEKGQPSAGMQVFIVAVLAISTRHTRFLLNITNRKAEAEFKLKIAELAATKNEATAAEALEVAQTQADVTPFMSDYSKHAHEATVQAKLADQAIFTVLGRPRGGSDNPVKYGVCEASRPIPVTQAKLAAECRAQLVESMRGMVLFHSDKNDLQGRAFSDLLVEEDVVRFQQYMQSEGVTFVGSYSTKISAVIYLTEIEHHDCSSEEHHDCSSKTYLVGLTEAELAGVVQEQEVCARRWFLQISGMRLYRNIFTINRPALQDVKDLSWVANLYPESAFFPKPFAPTPFISDADIPPEILPMEKEDKQHRDKMAALDAANRQKAEVRRLAMYAASAFVKARGVLKKRKAVTWAAPKGLRHGIELKVCLELFPEY